MPVPTSAQPLAPSAAAAVIPAEVHSDDRLMDIPFDALPFFEAATTEELVALAECDFGGDYPGDDVARFMETRDPNVRRLFEYLALGLTMPMRDDPVGFECHVEPEPALLWLAQHRPEVYVALPARWRNDVG